MQKANISKERAKAMRPYTAEHAERSQVIDGRIQLRYEALTGGLLQGRRLNRVWELPLDYLLRLADELDRASPAPATYDQWPSSIVQRVISKFDEDCR
ncbi:MAG TPA: hypothetical protein VG099_17145, partial [Gemmataceae bacterium]|nr:hypothetical protein [Gemmataceae bacterium]